VPPLVRASMAAAEFAYRKQRHFAADRIERRTDKFVVKGIRLASSGQNGQPANLVTARYYQSRLPGRKPLVIILPLWGVHTLPSNEMSEEITVAGEGAINVLQVHGERMLFDLANIAYAPTPEIFSALISEMADRVVTMVVDIRRLVDWAETRPEIDPDRIGLVGFSMGAMVASLALANEPRLHAGVLVAGSARPDEAFATCSGTAGKMRKMITERFNWSTARFRKSLERPLSRIDPARFAGRVDPRGVLIIEAGDDSCLTRKSRREFWEAMGRPERIVYHYDHRTTFMAMTFLGGGNLQEEAFRFLSKVFGINGGA